MFRISKSMETENRLVVAKSWEMKNGKAQVKGTGFLFR